MTCKECKYSMGTLFASNDNELLACCELTRHVVRAEMEHICSCFNVDLSKYDICYNCKYYLGGGDWGMFCTHKDMYYHLGKFNDEACKRFERKVGDDK